jgi:hypothetical protein
VTMSRRRILILGLDGFDIALAERFMREGLLPNFARTRSEVLTSILIMAATSILDFPGSSSVQAFAPATAAAGLPLHSTGMPMKQPRNTAVFVRFLPTSQPKP